MDAVALLHRAQEAGLRIETRGDTLLVRGPKRAEAVVKLLADHKAEVLAALSPSIGSWWRERFAAKAVLWFVGDRDWDAAPDLAPARPNPADGIPDFLSRRPKGAAGVASASANAGAATRARHLSHWGSNRPALTEVGYARG